MPSRGNPELQRIVSKPLVNIIVDKIKRKKVAQRHLAKVLALVKLGNRLKKKMVQLVPKKKKFIFI